LFLELRPFKFQKIGANKRFAASKIFSKLFLISLSSHVFLESFKHVEHKRFVDNIVEIGSRKIFSQADAQELLPLVYRLTEKAHAQVKHLMSHIEAMKNVPQSRLQEMENQVQVLIENWQNKIQKLGAHPKGYWLVDFDNGAGYYCWKFPEKEIKYSHGYKEGFTGRKEISTQFE